MAIKNTKKIDDEVHNYQNTLASSSRWVLANQVLYELCSKHPNHTNKDEIVAKLWLIGRSYAAAIERRKNANETTEDFYYDIVAPAMKSVSGELDNRIAMLNDPSTSVSEKIDDLLDTHAFLVSIFKSLTGMDKRSLASKYLHFHCPNAVFIYDSRAKTALYKMVQKPENVGTYCKGNRDSEYVDFCLRAIELRDYIANNHGLDLSLRELDTLLLNSKI